jgi:AhpC/TSA family
MLRAGDRAPEVPGVAFGDGPVGLFFFKVTCPTCQLAAPTMAAFDRSFPGRVMGVGQDPSDRLARFVDEYAMAIETVEDPPPYPASDAYGIETVPSLFLVGQDGVLLDAVGAWDREGFNRVAASIASITGGEAIEVSTPGDGLPAFKPG